MADRTLSRRRRSSPIERPRCCGRPALAHPLTVSRGVHHMDMWIFHQIDRTVEFWRGAGRRVWFEQTRRSDGGGDVGRAAVETMCAGRRRVFEGGMRRQRLVPVQDISLLRHHDYRSAEVVRLGGSSGMVHRCASMMWGLCLLRWPARPSRGQWADSTYIYMLPPLICVGQWGVE